ncbi:MAG: hypothetical protein OXC03_05665 [Flavobacteriaceae bacterium]|nr:hypothetical protein [Flavobacteriaceae bacterium]
MEFIKSRQFYFGIITSLLWTSALAIIIVEVQSQADLRQTLLELLKEYNLGGIIALSSLVNIPIFLFALRKEKIPFAAGLVAGCFLLFLVQFFL